MGQGVRKEFVTQRGCAVLPFFETPEKENWATKHTCVSKRVGETGKDTSPSVGFPEKCYETRHCSQIEGYFPSYKPLSAGYTRTFCTQNCPQPSDSDCFPEVMMFSKLGGTHVLGLENAIHYRYMLLSVICPNYAAKHCLCPGACLCDEIPAGFGSPGEKVVKAYVYISMCDWKQQMDHLEAAVAEGRLQMVEM